MNKELLEALLYQWACGNISTKDSNKIAEQQRVIIDFRQQITDNVIVGFNIETGREERFKV